MEIQRVEASYHNLRVGVPLLDEPEERDPDRKEGLPMILHTGLQSD